ncbi:hypothetical protein [Roseivirga sp.]|uniref:hypothetical protein n=1 Tax=Roseivirga sp. TaxID=1964215 RepID=UPI003B51A5E2
MNERAIQYLEDLQLKMMYDQREHPLLNQAMRDSEQGFIENRDNKTYQRSVRILEEIFSLGGKSIKDFPQFSELFNKQREKLISDLKNNSRNYSKYESPIFIATIEQARKIADKGIRHLFGEMSTKDPDKSKEYLAKYESIAFGSLPDTSFNASAIRVGKGEDYIVILNRNVPQFLSRMARIIVKAETSVTPESLKKLNTETDEWKEQYDTMVQDVLKSKQNEYLLDSFLAAIFDYYNIESNFEYEVEKFAGPERILSEIMTIGAEVFIIGHEYNHILDGHLMNWETSNALPQGIKMDFGKRDHMMEFAADIAGIGNLIVSFGSHAHPFLPNEDYERWLLNGIQLFFSSAQIIEDFNEAFDVSTTVEDTHPPSSDRFSLLYHQLKEMNSRYESTYFRLQCVIENLVEHSIHRYNNSIDG